MGGVIHAACWMSPRNNDRQMTGIVYGSFFFEKRVGMRRINGLGGG